MHVVQQVTDSLESIQIHKAHSLAMLLIRLGDFSALFGLLEDIPSELRSTVASIAVNSIPYRGPNLLYTSVNILTTTLLSFVCLRFHG